MRRRRTGVAVAAGPRGRLYAVGAFVLLLVAAAAAAAAAVYVVVLFMLLVLLHRYCSLTGGGGVVSRRRRRRRRPFFFFLLSSSGERNLQRTRSVVPPGAPHTQSKHTPTTSVDTSSPTKLNCTPQTANTTPNTGGSSDGSHGLSSVETFDPREGKKWEPSTRMIFGRAYCCASFSASGCLYVLGGTSVPTGVLR